MKESDLRIGNYVIYEATTHVVHGILEDTVYSWWVKDGQPVIEKAPKDASGVMVLDPYLDKIENYSPIPLNEKWLTDFGFKKEGIAFNSPSDEFDIIVHGSEDGIRWTASNVFVGRIGNWDRDGINFVCMGNCFRYIHQLQNLYFALTGEELKLN